MTEPLQRVLGTKNALTLASVPTGFLPWLCADLARAAHGTSGDRRAVAIVADEAAMRALAETVPFFARGGRGADVAGLGLPPLRPRLPCLASHGRATRDAQRASGDAHSAAAIGGDRERGLAANADAIPHPPAHPPNRGG